MKSVLIRPVAVLISCLLAVAFCSCDAAPSSDLPSGTSTEESRWVTNPDGETVYASDGNSDKQAESDSLPAVTYADEPTSSDSDLVYDTLIQMSNEGCVTNGPGVAVSGSTVTIHKVGTYLLRGSLSDGQIVVDLDESEPDENVTLLLNGLSVTCADGPAILIQNAPKKAILYTVADSVNLLSDGTGYVVPDGKQVDGGVYPNACIYACDDLKLDGEGTLYVTGNADKGINTKDDLKLSGGTWVVTSTGVGLRGNDSVSISGGHVTVTSDGDGIKSGNTESEGKGTVEITGGTVHVSATGDGIYAATDLMLKGGTCVIVTKDADATSLSTDEPEMEQLAAWGGGMPPGGGGPGGMMGEGNSNKSSISAKGLKADGNLTVSGGKVTLTSADDGLHATDNIVINDGELYIKAADDGIHADDTLIINAGVIEIAQSYEGLEACNINLNGGTVRITASDDGLNATDGMGGGMWMPGSSTTTTGNTPLVTITGGYYIINASGDGLDSNGSIRMSGGSVYVYGPTNNGNGALDVGDAMSDTMTISGGTLLAVGSSGMAECPDNDGQAVLAGNLRSSALPAGTLLGFLDADGNVLAVFELPKQISSIVYSSSAIRAEAAYTVVYGGSVSGHTTVDGIVSGGTYTGYTELGTITAS